MKKNFFNLLVLVIILNLGLPSIVVASPPHTPPGLPKKLANEEIQIRPAKPLTRLEALQLAVNDLNLTSTNRTANFKDHIKIPKEYAGYASRLMELNIFSEKDSFQPNKPLTRAEMAVLIVKLTNIQESKSTDITLSRFKDANAIPAHAKSSVAALIEEGIIIGAIGTNNEMVFQPNFPVTLNVWNIIMDRVEKILPNKDQKDSYREVEGEILYLSSFKSKDYILIKTANDIQLHDVTNAEYSEIKFSNLKVGDKIFLIFKDEKLFYLGFTGNIDKSILSLEFNVRYSNGQIIFSVINKEEFDITIDFPTLQIYDFVVKDSSGNKVWQWSRGRSFGQQQQTISYNKSTTIEYQESWQPDKPGIYIIEAYLTNNYYKDKLVATAKIIY